MNIGIVTTWMERGAAYVSMQYKTALDKENNVFIYARGGENYAIGDPNWDFSYVTWGKKSPIPVSGAIVKSDFLKWIKKNNIETVLFNEQQWWIPIKWANEAGLKTVAYVDYYTEETIPLFKYYDAVICNTKRHYSVFDWHHNAHYLPWGTDTNLFSPKTDIEHPDKVTFFHSAGMSPQRKGTASVLRAFEKLSTESKLIIHTQIDLSEVLPDFGDLIENLRATSSLEIITKSVPAPGLFHLADIYVYPTILEGIGLTIIEALSCGLPVITSNEAPMNEFISEKNGKLVNIESRHSRSDGYYWPVVHVDTENLKQAMQFYIDNIKDIQEMKNAARVTALYSYDWFKNSSSLSQLFTNLEKLEHSSYSQLINYEKKKRNVVVKFVSKYQFIFRLLFAVSDFVGFNFLNKLKK